MWNNSNKNNNPKTTARTPAERQGASANTSLAQRREKSVIRLPEDRRKGTKYQVIRGQYLGQSNKKETADITKTAAIKNVAAKPEEKQEKAKRQTAAEKSVKNEKEKDKASTAKSISHENNEAKDEYAKSAKAEEYAERLQTNIDLSKAVNIPPPVTWDQILDNAVKKDSIYSHNDSAHERALQYKEKVDFYLKKMQKNSETGKKEVNLNRDKDAGTLYKKAYKLAHKEELLGKKNSTLFNKAQSVIQLKSEVDNALNKDNTGEAVAAVAAIPLARTAQKAVQKLADKNHAVNAGKTGFELVTKVTAEVASADSVGEATANAVAAVPKYVVEKKAEKTVHQVMQNQHVRKIEAQKKKLREKQEKVEKRAQDMRKENMQRKMKADLYKSEHGITSNGNNILKNVKAVIKNTLESMKRAVTAIKSSGTLLMAAAGGTLVPILFVGIIIIIVLLLVIFPFFYTSEDGKEDEIEDSTFGETVLHYYGVMDGVVDKINAEIDEFLQTGSDYDNTGVENPEKKAQYDSDYADYQTQVEALESTYYDDSGEAFNNYVDTYGWDFFPKEPEKDYWYSYEELSDMGMERGPIFEGFVMSDESDAARVPKGQLYDEMLCTISTYNTKLMTRPETIGGSSDESEDYGESGGSGEIIFMNDENVAAIYGGSDFWEFNHWEEGVDCPSGGDCCSKTVPVEHRDKNGNLISVTFEEVSYCPTHYVIMWEVLLDFDLDRIWGGYDFDEEDEKNYKEVKKEFDKEKENAGIT